MNKMNYSTYQSPFSWRYGSKMMREVFSEEYKYKLWRRIWVALAKAQSRQGLVSKKELSDLEKNQDNINIERILEIEKETRHDVVAAIKEFAEKAKIGGGKIHLGATSMDIQDNADTVRLTEAINIIEEKLHKLLTEFSLKVEKYSDFPCMGYTHLQPAEPTTLGYRFAFYSQDLVLDLKLLKFVKKGFKGKGLKGAVGTSASYLKLISDKQSFPFSDEKNKNQMENEVMEELGIESALITGQTAPRKMDLLVSQVLVSIAQSLHKFAFDIRVMQSPGFGELQEPFSKTQVGSSAMPFKKNPVKSEQICSLARLVQSLSRNAADNASLTLLERTIDDSANRRVYLPEMFLAVDEILESATAIVSGLIVNEAKIQENLERYAPFSASEEIIIESAKKGANRQEMHEVLRKISMEAWALVSVGEENPMVELLCKEQAILRFLSEEQITQLINPAKHLGDAPERAKKYAKLINKITKQ